MKYIVTLNSKNYEVEVEETDAVITAVTAAEAPAPAAKALPDKAAPAAEPSVQAGEGTQVLSPMPGTVLELNVSVGAAVRAGDTLLILEAMKMENEIVSPGNGTVKQLLVSKGASVGTDDVLAVIG